MRIDTSTPLYVFIAWCLISLAQGQLYLLPLPLWSRFFLEKVVFVHIIKFPAFRQKKLSLHSSHELATGSYS
jgi:hypothetical protein